MIATAWRLGLCLVLFTACGGSTPPAESAADQPAADSSADSDTPAPSKASDADKSADDKPAEKPATEQVEPKFTENMSVDEATKAVPPGIERANIDQETLGKPLQDMSVYEPCKPGSNHVKIRVAIWLGKAVGTDITTSPKNEKLANCIRGRIQELTWEKKVRSLNTIEFSL